MSGRKAALENRHTIRLDDETNKSLIAKAVEKNLLNISETFLLNISERLPDGWIEKI